MMGPRGWELVYLIDDRQVWAGVDWRTGRVFVAATDPFDLPDTFEEVWVAMGREQETPVED